MAFSAKLIVVVVALFSQGLCASHVRRSADGAPDFDKLMADARSNLEKIGEELINMTGTTPEVLRTAMEAKSQELQTRAQSVMDEVKKQIETHGAEMPEKTREAFNEISTHLKNAIDNLKSQAPGTLDEMTAVQQRFAESFKSGMETFLEETKKLAKAAGDETGEMHDKVATFATESFRAGIDWITQFNNKVKEAVEQASH